MAANAQLVITVVTKTTDAIKGLDQTQKKASGMKGVLQKAAAPAAAALGLLAKGAWDSASAAVADEKSASNLAATLQKNTGATKTQVGAVEDWISKMSLATGVADDDLRPALGTLVRATGDTTKAQDAMKTAMDVAAATGKPLKSVTSAMAKGFAGSTTAIGRLVPGLDKGALASGDMSKVMDELNKKTGGAAAKAADTTAGRMARMKIAMDETKESIGYALLPALTKLMGILLKVANFALKHSTAFIILGAAIAGVAVGVLAANAAMWLLSASPAMLWVMAITAAIIVLVAGIILLWKKCQTFRAIVIAAFNAVKGAVMAVINWFRGPFASFFTTTLPGFFTKAWNKAKSVTMTVVNAVITFVKSIPQKVKNGIANLLGFVRDAFKNAFERGKERVTTIGGQIITWVKGIPGKAKAALVTLLATIRDKFKDAMDAGKQKVVDGITTIIGEIKKVPGKIADVGAKMLEAGGKLAQKVIDGIKGAFQKAGGIASDVASAVKNAINTVLHLPLTFGPIKLPGPVPDIPQVTVIPKLAKGGIVRSPTLALLGEAGPEAVVPLNGSAGVVGPITVEVYLDGEQIGTFVQKRVDASMAAQARRIRLRVAS